MRRRGEHATAGPGQGHGPVVFWITSLGNGGAERQLTEVVIRLHERGRPVSVVALLGGVHLERLRAAGVPVTCPRRGGAVVGFLRALGPLSRARTVVTFLFVPNLLGRLLRGVLGYRLVTCFRSVWFGNRLRHRLLRATRRADDAWVSNGVSSAERLVQEGFAAPGRGTVVPNGVDVPPLRDPPAGPFTWVSVGRFRPEKDHATLLRAWAAIRDRGRARLRLVGDGPREPHLRRLAKSLGISSTVEFTGPVDHAGPAYDAAHAVVLSSLTESSPNSVLEAFAHGRPVVATAVGGTPEVVPDGAGILVPPQDAEALAVAMAELMQGPLRRCTSMGRTGRAHVSQVRGWDAVVLHWDEVLWPPGGRLPA